MEAFHYEMLKRADDWLINDCPFADDRWSPQRTRDLSQSGYYLPAPTPHYVTSRAPRKGSLLVITRNREKIFSYLLDDPATPLFEWVDYAKLKSVAQKSISLGASICLWNMVQLQHAMRLPNFDAASPYWKGVRTDVLPALTGVAAPPVTDRQLGDRGYVTDLAERAILAESYWNAVVDVLGSAEAMMAKNLVTAGHEAARANDYETAFESFVSAAMLGSREGMFFVGRSYQAGTGVGQSARSAARWLERSANRGYAGAMSALGDVYYTTQSSLSRSTAFQWYSNAVDNGNLWPLERMGEMAAAGDGTAASTEIGNEHLTKAREFYRSQAGTNVWACYRLGVMTRDGIGGPANDGVAYDLIARAAGQGLQVAIDALESADNGVKKN